MKTEVMEKGKMKEVLAKVVMYIAVVMLCVINCYSNIKAENTRNDQGVEANVTTQKKEYRSNEVIKGKIEIVNNSENVITKVSYNQEKLEGYDISVSGIEKDNGTTLRQGESINYEVTLIPVQGMHNIEDEEVPLEDGELEETTLEEGELDEVPQTDSDTNYGLLVLMVCSGIVVLVVIARKLKLRYDRRYIAYILLFGIIGGLLQPMGSVVAKAETKQLGNMQNVSADEDDESCEDNKIDISYIVTIDEKEVELIGSVSYVVSEETKDSEEAVTDDKEQEDVASVKDAYTVTFDLGYEGAKDAETQTVKRGEYATEPEKPDREGYVFIGWYEEGKEYPDMYLSEVYPVEKDMILTAQWLEVGDDTDTDGDGVIDSLEILLLMEKENSDTDGDGLDDGLEISIGTSPLKADSDDNGIKDRDEDYDKDGVPNLIEIQMGANPMLEDSDKDSLSDGEEVKIHKTNPTLADTDGDGADDKTEIELKTNPLKADEYFDVVMESSEEDTVKAAVSIRLKGNQLSTLNVERVHNDAIFPEEIPGYLGGAYDFSVDGTFESATLIFEFDESLVGSEKFDPVIYYYNEEEQLFEPLETTVVGNVASAKTTHFSSYILLNRVVWEGAFAWVDVWENKDYKSVEIVFVVDDSGSMTSNDPYNYRKEVVKQLIEKVPYDSSVGIIIYSDRVWDWTYGLKEKYAAYDAASFLPLFSEGGTKMYSAINRAIYMYKSKDESVLKMMVVLTDGAASDKEYHDSIIDAAKENDIKICCVGLNCWYKYVNDYLRPLATATGGKYYSADDADKLAQIFKDIENKIDIRLDSDGDGIPDYYEENMVLFNGVQIKLDKYNTDTDMDGVPDKEEIGGFHMMYNADKTKVMVIGKMKTNPLKHDSDGDGLYDYSERTVIIDGEEVVVAPKDTQPLTPNGTKGLWDKHVEMYETTDIPTEYGDYEEEWEDTEEYVGTLVELVFKQYMRNNYRIIKMIPTLFVSDMLAYPIIDRLAEGDRDFVMYVVEHFRSGEITQEQAKELLKEALKLRGGLRDSGTLEKTAYVIKELVDLAEDRGLEVGAFMLTFVPDEEELAYHSRPDTWQRSFGYNGFYDEIFNMATKMHYDMVTFNVRGTEYALWMWKGDYWNLKSGAEIGLYYNPTDIEGTTHYEVVPFELPMTLGLYNYYSEDSIECIFNWAPEEKQWWITGFNPEFDEPNCNDMVVIGSIDFVGRESMYEELKYYLETKYLPMKNYFIFDEDGHTVWIIWDKKEESVFEKFKNYVVNSADIDGM